MGYSAQTFVAGEQPTTAKWNLLWSNDASFNDATGIGSGVISAAKMKYGMVRQRQGGVTGDATWLTAGTSNTDTSAKDVFIQAGEALSIVGSGLTVTFPVAFTQVPLVFLAVQGGGAFISEVEISPAPSTTQFTFAIWTTAGALAARNTNWLAIGQ